jgi:diketogulonate reductase-like aldo/keto reductase
MGEDARLRKQEIAALRAGIDLGMTLIDTAEMYGDGATESLLGEPLAGIRDQVFLVSKVYPQNAGRGRIERACDASLQRLKTDALDLYLLHWRGSVPLAETIEDMEGLCEPARSADGASATSTMETWTSCSARAARPARRTKSSTM